MELTKLEAQETGVLKDILHEGLVLYPICMQLLLKHALVMLNVLKQCKHPIITSLSSQAKLLITSSMTSYYLCLLCGKASLLCCLMLLLLNRVLKKG